MKTITKKDLRNISEENSSEVELIPLPVNSLEHIYFVSAGTVNGTEDLEYNAYKLPRQILNTEREYSLFIEYNEAIVCTPSELGNRISDFKKLTQRNSSMTYFLLIWEIGLPGEFGVYFDDSEHAILNDEGDYVDSFEFYPDNTSVLVFNSIKDPKDGKWYDGAFIKGFVAEGPTENITIKWEDAMKEDYNTEVTFTEIPKRELSEQEAETLYRIFYNEGVFEAVDYLDELGYDVGDFWNEIYRLASDDDYNRYDGDELDAFYDLLDYLEIYDKFDVEYNKEPPTESSSDEGYVFEDVNDEVEFIPLPERKFTDISNKYKEMMESYGITDVKIHNPILAERLDCFWYDDVLISGRYKDRYTIVFKVYSGDYAKIFATVDGEDIEIEYVDDLYSLGIYDDESFYEFTNDLSNDISYDGYPECYMAVYDDKHEDDGNINEADEIYETIDGCFELELANLDELINWWEDYNDEEEPSSDSTSKIEEDVNDEVEFIPIPTPTLTDCTKELTERLKYYGFTNIEFKVPVYKERNVATWYSGHNVFEALYKNRYKVTIWASGMDSFYEIASEEYINTPEELESYGIYTDAEYYDDVRYYEEEDRIIAYEYEPYFVISTDDLKLNSRDIDEEYWWNLDTIYDISDLLYTLSDNFPEMIYRYESELGEYNTEENTVTEGKTNILKQWQKKHKKTDKKGARGWFVNPNAGNVEYNVSFFNNAMSGGNSSGEAVSTGVAEDLHNLDEEVVVHDELNPKLWVDETLKEEVFEKIALIVDTFTESLEEDGIKFEIDDVVIVGSNCSYNYNNESDLDVHIRVKSDTLECPAEISTLLYGAYRNIFNKKFDIDFYGIDVELYVEDENSTVNSNGIYSVMNREWIKKPEKTSIPEIDNDELNTELSKWEEEYYNIKKKAEESTEDSQHLEVVELITNFIEDIYDLRRMSIADDGEYAIGNLVFKEFRAKGLLDEAKDLKNSELSKAMSLKENLKEALDLKHIDSIEKLLKLKGLVEEDGTYSVEDGKLIKKNLDSGFMVSFFRPEITNKDIVRCREFIGKSLGEPYYGIYQDIPEISFNLDSKNFAMEIAKIFNQESIWDNSSNKEIKNPKFNKNKVVDYLEATNNFKHLLGVREKRKEKK